MTAVSSPLSPIATAALMAVSSPAASDVQYVYDSAGRLSKATYSNGITIEYRYDAAGNRREIVTTRVANRPPVAINDMGSVAQSASVDIQVRTNDDDPDGHPLTVTGVTQPSGGGTASIIGGGAAVRYAATTTSGLRAFNYTISDGNGGSDTATVTIDVNAANTPPTAMPDYSATSVSTAVIIHVLQNDTDPQGQTLVVSSVGSASGGVASLGPKGSYIIFDAPSQPGQFTFSYTISDGAAGSGSAIVTVDVSAFEGPGSCVPRSGVQCEIN